MSKLAQVDVVVVGGGMVGLAAALACARLGKTVLIVEAHPPVLQCDPAEKLARVVAINPRSQQLLTEWGAWSLLAQRQVLSPYEHMTVWQQGKAAKTQIEFDAANVPLPHLGHIVPNREIVRALALCLQACPLVQWACPDRLVGCQTTEVGVSVQLMQRGTVQATLLIAADGAHSWLRQHFGLNVAHYDYQQRALIAVIHTEYAHAMTAWQAFSTTGPLGVLPLCDLHHCAIVWSNNEDMAARRLTLAPEVFSQELTAALDARLGAMEVVSPVQAFPLVQRHILQYALPHVVFVGDAAHTIHPLAGQGVNLGLQDVACLTRVLAEDLADQKPFARFRTLRAYARERQAENQIMLSAMKAFHRGFTSSSTLISTLAGLALGMADRSVRLKHLFVQRA